MPFGNVTSAKSVKDDKPNRTYLYVSYDERHDAKKAGARWDKDKLQWYTLEDLDTFLDKYTGMTKQERKLQSKRNKIRSIERSIWQNGNADITIPCPKTLIRLNQELKQRVKELKELEDEEYGSCHDRDKALKHRLKVIDKAIKNVEIEFSDA